MFNSKRPIITPADIEGHEDPGHGEPSHDLDLQPMGAAATPMAIGELYSAIQQGVVDGAENSPVFYRSQKYYEVAKYYAFTDHFLTPDYPMMSLKWFNAQPKDIQDAITQAGKEMIEKERQFWLEYEKFVNDDLKAKGVLFNDVPDKAAFAKLVEPIYKDFEGKIGKDLIDKARAE